MLIWFWLKTSEGKENEGCFVEGKKKYSEANSTLLFFELPNRKFTYLYNSSATTTTEAQQDGKVSTFTCCVAYAKFLIEENS